MAVAFWPTSLPQIPQARSFRGGPQDNRVAFQPMAGVPITRPRTTGMVKQITAVFRQLTWSQFETFEGFVATDINQGSSSFIWRHPVGGDPRWWRLAGGETLYQEEHLENGRVNVSLALYLQPAIPWFADYIPAGVSRVPYFVADYANGVYGIDGKTVAASALTTIAGTFWVQRTTTTEITEAQETLIATDIPASAPGTTTKIIGFET